MTDVRCATRQPVRHASVLMLSVSLLLAAAGAGAQEAQKPAFPDERWKTWCWEAGNATASQLTTIEADVQRVVGDAEGFEQEWRAIVDKGRNEVRRSASILEGLRVKLEEFEQRRRAGLIPRNATPALLAAEQARDAADADLDRRRGLVAEATRCRKAYEQSLGIPILETVAQIYDQLKRADAAVVADEIATGVTLEQLRLRSEWCRRELSRELAHQGDDPAYANAFDAVEAAERKLWVEQRKLEHYQPVLDMATTRSNIIRAHRDEAAKCIADRRAQFSRPVAPGPPPAQPPGPPRVLPPDLPAGPPPAPPPPPAPAPPVGAGIPAGKPGAVWKRKPGYPQPDQALTGYIQRGDVRVSGGSFWCKYWDGQKDQTATWTFDEPPATLEEGKVYTWSLTATDASAARVPAPPANLVLLHARLGVVGNTPGSGNTHETKAVKFKLTDADNALNNAATTDRVSFTFASGNQFIVGVSGCGYAGGFTYVYEHDPSGTGAGAGAGAGPGGTPGQGPARDPAADQPVFLTLYEWQAQRVVQADGWVSGVVKDLNGNIVGVYRRPYLRPGSSSYDPTQPLAFQRTRGFFVGPAIYEALSSPMSAPTDPARIEQEINTLLMQIDMWQKRQLAAQNSGDAAEYARAQAALPGLQLRLRVLNSVQMNNK